MKDLGSRRRLIPYLILAAVSLGGYLVASRITYRVGFPLDDAWIHQAYARNLAFRGEWAFLPGQPSAGSTSPLWSFLLAPGYWIGASPHLWTYLLGWMLLVSLALLTVWAIRLLVPERSRWAPWVGLAVLLEWHLVWAAGSGMETLLALVLFTLVLVWICSRTFNPLWVGMVVGLGTWVRPDAITLLGPVGMVILLRGTDIREKIREVGRAALGFALFFGPYLAFNAVLAGSAWPNTFYAKQREYEILQLLPYGLRYLNQARLPLVGVGLVLLPGFFRFVWQSWRRRWWAPLAGVIWFLGYLGIYAWRLPVTYQHGRYVMPAMALFFLWGAAGMVDGLKLESPVTVRRVASRVWASVAVLVLAGFWFLGARSYGQDTAFIETEMVAVAHWVAAETPPDAVIAAHDIGAIGYFGGRELVDMAGLVSPEVIPFIRDEGALARYLDQREVDYLVTFPAWYPFLTRDLVPLFTTSGAFGPALGGENMAAYDWGGRE